MVRAFDQTADFLEKVRQLAWYDGLLQAVAAFAGFKRTDRVLDVGCGTGALERKLARQVSEIKGVDFSATMIARGEEHARRKRLKNVSFEVGSIDKLPFADNEFDVVIGLSVIYLLEKPQSGVAEMVRVAGPGGKIIVAEPSVEMRPERLRMFSAKKGLAGFAFEALYYWLGVAEAHNRFSVIDMERLLEKAGLKNIVVAEELDRMVLMAKGIKPLL